MAESGPTKRPRTESEDVAGLLRYQNDLLGQRLRDKKGELSVLRQKFSTASSELCKMTDFLNRFQIEWGKLLSNVQCICTAFHGTRNF